MGTPAKFLFEHDFRQPAPDAGKVAAVQEAEARAYLRGLNDGQRQGQAQAQIEVQAQLAVAMERLAHAAGTMLSDLDAHRTATEALAIDFALTLGRKLAGDLLAREPLAAIAKAAAQSFQHLRGVSHLVVRVNDALVEDVDQLIQSMARERGFEGRLVTLGEPEIPLGDIRLEWADGGIVRDQSRIDQAVAKALGRS
jgi:flagellar assembly protein FliH